MTPYSISCCAPGCQNAAVYKIAARWTDGLTAELKTYGLCCPSCLPAWFRHCRQKQAACRLTAGEILDAPGVYHLERGQRDQRLRRLPDLEQQLGEA